MSPHTCELCTAMGRSRLADVLMPFGVLGPKPLCDDCAAELHNMATGPAEPIR